MQEPLGVYTGKSVAMVTAHFLLNHVESITFTVLKQMKSNLVDFIALRYRCGTHNFCVCLTKRCHGNHIFL